VQDRRRGDDGPKPEVNYLLVAGVPERGVRRAGDGRYACGTMPLVDGAELTAHLHSTVVANDTTYLPNKRDAPSPEGERSPKLLFFDHVCTYTTND
jgi:hypothetical protein